MFSLKSQAFEYGGQIPARYAEKNVLSPPLIWENTPEGTKSFALAMTDPDLPPEFQFPRVFAHWMIYNIPASATSLVEGISPGGNLPSECKELNSDFVTFKIPGYGKGYGGPWPPDSPHRYVFTLYALKTEKLDIHESAAIGDFAEAVLPVTILTATLVGYYGPAKEKLPGA
jgi:Raf kinase inhibitor-like YbhB/YbcL family protein